MHKHNKQIRNKQKKKDSITVSQRRQWHPTPVFLPGESQGRGSLVGCRLWGRTESDTTEVTWQEWQQEFLTLPPSLFMGQPLASAFSPFSSVILYQSFSGIQQENRKLQKTQVEFWWKRLTKALISDRPWEVSRLCK